MASVRYVRWQGLAINQLSIAVGLISGLSAAGIGFGVSQLSSESNISIGLVLASILFLSIAALCSAGAVVTRLLDFRLTTRKVRKDSEPDYDKPLEIFRRNKDEYGRATWRLFWAGQISFLMGFSLLAVAYGNLVATRAIERCF